MDLKGFPMNFPAPLQLIIKHRRERTKYHFFRYNQKRTKTILSRMRIGKPIPKNMKGQKIAGEKYGAAKEIPVRIIKRKFNHLRTKVMQPIFLCAIRD